MQSALRETVNLPSVKNTRQNSKNTRQRLCRVLHSAKDTRKRDCRQRVLCRVHFVGHSAKLLPSAKRGARQTLSAVTEQVYDGRFAECQNLALGKDCYFAECHIPGTRQTSLLCRLSDILALGKVASFAECQTSFAECRDVRHSAK
jgi:hypothetical protein